MKDREVRRRGFERRIGRWLILATYLSVAILTIGVVLLVATGVSPLDGGPGLDPATIPAGLVALRPEAFLWTGLLVVIATPVTRVIAAAMGFAGTGERMLVLAAAGILATVLASVASVVLVGGG